MTPQSEAALVLAGATLSLGIPIGFKAVGRAPGFVGSRFLLEGVHGPEISDRVRESVMAELRKSFRPEFLNRIDETWISSWST